MEKKKRNKKCSARARRRCHRRRHRRGRYERERINRATRAAWRDICIYIYIRALGRDARGGGGAGGREGGRRGRARGNRALPSTRLTLPMIVIGSTAKSEGINYPCGFPIPPLLPPLP